MVMHLHVRGIQAWRSSPLHSWSSAEMLLGLKVYMTVLVHAESNVTGCNSKVCAGLR